MTKQQFSFITRDMMAVNNNYNEKKCPELWSVPSLILNVSNTDS